MFVPSYAVQEIPERAKECNKGLYNVSECISGNKGTPQWTEECHKIANMATKPHPHQITLSLNDSCFEDSDPINPKIQIDSSWFSPGEKAKKVGMIKFRSRFMPMAWWPWLPRGQLMGREGVPSKWWSVPTCCRSALCSHYTLQFAGPMGSPLYVPTTSYRIICLHIVGTGQLSMLTTQQHARTALSSWALLYASTAHLWIVQLGPGSAEWVQPGSAGLGSGFGQLFTSVKPFTCAHSQLVFFQIFFLFYEHSQIIYLSQTIHMHTLSTVHF